MLRGVKAILQKLNGSQQQPNQLPISVPSLVVGHHVAVDAPPHSAHTESSAAAAFKYDPQGISQQPQGRSHEGPSQQPVTLGASTAEVAEPCEQQADEWDVLLRCFTALISDC